MIAERFLVVSRAHDPRGQQKEPFFVNWDTPTPLDRSAAVALSERLAMENPQNEVYVAELRWHSVVEPDRCAVKTLEVG